jgi:hypothetical protein
VIACGHRIAGSLRMMGKRQTIECPAPAVPKLALITSSTLQRRKGCGPWPMPDCEEIVANSPQFRLNMPNRAILEASLAVLKFPHRAIEATLWQKPSI